ncbi:hypothetical protein BS78_10G111700 [Paspalum vaginatum]|nr:hypothetical protein BS78_10G111700 [Paspalum vaginatum]
MAVHSSAIGELEGLIPEQELVHRRLEAAQEAVNRWVLRRAASDAGAGVPDSLDELAVAVRELVSLGSDDGSNGQHAKIVLQELMVHLEDEFRQILISGTYFLPPGNLQASRHNSIALPARSFSFSSYLNLEELSISSFTTTTDDSQTYCSGFTRDSVSTERVHLYLIDPEASILLKEIAELIILADHAPNLCRVYSEIRHSTLMQCLYLLGVQSEHAAAISEGGLNMQLYSRKVKLWIQGLKTFVGTVLPEERHACSQIFGCNNMVEQDCFTRGTTRCTQELLAVGTALAKANVQHCEKLPLLLQMHEEFAKLQPSLQDMFSGDARDLISQEASMLLGKLEEAARGVLLDVSSLQFNHGLDECPALDGNILAFTQFVIGFIKVLAEYSTSLNLIVHLEEEDGIKSTPMAPWERYVLRLLSHLQLKIEGESKVYKDERLRYIFLMNNAMYVLEHLRSLVLRMSFVYDQTHEKLVLLVEEYATAYFRATWFATMFHLKLRDEQNGTYPLDKRMVRSILKGRLKNFNLAFEEIRRVQTTWKVPNPQLRQHLRIVILNQVFPAYRTYLRRCSSLLSANPDKYIKYSPEDIENLVLDLFEG